MFKKAVKNSFKIRLALSGISGGGKTYSALSIASGLGKRIALIDSEAGSSNRYAGIFDFDVCTLTSYRPADYSKAINFAGKEGYDVIIIDSMSHAWFAELEMVGGRFDKWKDVRPQEAKLISDILHSPAHVIATMRAKSEYVMEESKNGKRTAPKKVGTVAIQASGIEYEFDLAGEMSGQGILTMSKSRCPELAGAVISHPGEELAQTLLAWSSDDTNKVEDPAFEPVKETPKPIVELTESEEQIVEEAAAKLMETTEPEPVGPEANAIVKTARTEAKLAGAEVKLLMAQVNSEVKTPAEMTSDQLDALLTLIEQQAKG